MGGAAFVDVSVVLQLTKYDGSPVELCARPPAEAPVAGVCNPGIAVVDLNGCGHVRTQ